MRHFVSPMINYSYREFVAVIFNDKRTRMSFYCYNILRTGNVTNVGLCDVITSYVR